MKKLKEEQATVEKILEHLKSGKDVRKNNWQPKEVRDLFGIPTLIVFMMNKSFKLDLIPALRMSHHNPTEAS